MKYKHLGLFLYIIIFCSMGIFFFCNKDKKEEIKQPEETLLPHTYYESLVESKPEIYDYRLTITDAQELLRTSNIQRGWRDEPPLKMSAYQIKALNGIYEWKSPIFFKTQREMFDYICENFNEMQRYKVGLVPASQIPIKSSKHHNIYDEYQDRLEDYLDDPEDEITFDPEVFDFQDD